MRGSGLSQAQTPSRDPVLANTVRVCKETLQVKSAGNGKEQFPRGHLDRGIRCGRTCWRSEHIDSYELFKQMVLVSCFCLLVKLNWVAGAETI